MTSILLSYRRVDSEAMTGRIRERLVSYYGRNSIFMDIHQIPLGVDFRTFLKDEILKHDFVLVIIGPKWRGAGEDGHARIDDEADPVRSEVEAALTRKGQTIPILIGGAVMPKPSEVPKTLEQLCYLNGATIDAGLDFPAHMKRLITRLDDLERDSRSATARAVARIARHKRSLGWTTAAVLVGCVSAGTVYANRDRVFPAPVRDSAVLLVPPPQRLRDDIALKEHAFKTIWSHFFSGLSAQRKFDVRPKDKELLDTNSEFWKGSYGPQVSAALVLAGSLAKYGDTIGRRIEFVARSDVYTQGDNVRVTIELYTLDIERPALQQVADARVAVEGPRSKVELLAIAASYQLVAKFLPVIGLADSAEQAVAEQFTAALRAENVRSEMSGLGPNETCRDLKCMERVTASILNNNKRIDQSEVAEVNLNTQAEASRLARGVPQE